MLASEYALSSGEAADELMVELLASVAADSGDPTQLSSSQSVASLQEHDSILSLSQIAPPDSVPGS